MCCQHLEEISGTHRTSLLELCLSHLPGRNTLGEQSLLTSGDLEKPRSKAVVKNNPIPAPGTQGGGLQVLAGLFKSPSPTFSPKGDFARRNLWKFLGWKRETDQTQQKRGARAARLSRGAKWRFLGDPGSLWASGVAWEASGMKAVGEHQRQAGPISHFYHEPALSYSFYFEEKPNLYFSLKTIYVWSTPCCQISTFITQTEAWYLWDLEWTIYNIGVAGQGDLQITKGQCLARGRAFQRTWDIRPLPCLRGPGSLQTEEMSKQD